MKKISLFVLSLFLIFMTNACKEQEQFFPTEERNLSLKVEEKEGRLVFDNRNDYQTVVENNISLQRVGNLPDSYVSNANMNARIGQSDKEILAEVPEQLLRMLNDDFVLQVGKWVMKLDFFERKVYVVENQYAKSLYNDLITGRVGEHVYEFGMDYDVLDLLDEGYTSVPEGSERSEGIFCGGGVGINYNRGSKILVEAKLSNNFVYTYVFYSVSQYQKYGVWFEFASVVRMENNNVTVTQQFERNVTWELKQNCKNGDFRKGVERGYVGTAWNVSNGYNQHKTVVYTSITGLQYVNMESTYTSAEGVYASTGPFGGIRGVSFSSVYQDKR